MHIGYRDALGKFLDHPDQQGGTREAVMKELNMMRSPVGFTGGHMEIQHWRIKEGDDGSLVFPHNANLAYALVHVGSLIGVDCQELLFRVGELLFSYKEGILTLKEGTF